MKGPWTIGLLISLAIGVGCRPNDQEILLEIHTTKWSDPDSPESGATVILEEQRLQNGVLNSFFTEVERATTDGSGVVQLSTIRSNVLSIRIRVEQTDCFDEVVELNPESLASDGTINEVDVSVMPQCRVNGLISNTNNVCPSSDLIFRWIPRDVVGAASEVRWTCDTQWQGLPNGEFAEEYCWISGDTWLLHHRYWACLDSTHLDSVWCPKGAVVQLTLD